MVKTKTYSFWTHSYHRVTGVIKVCITVSVITKSLCRANQRTRRCFFKFWNAGPDRITRKLAIKKLSSSGLRIPQKAFKISWLRRVIQQANNTSRHILNQIYFDKVLSLGEEYARNLAVHIRNPFWKDVLISWAEFCKEVKSEEIKSVISAPLWFNTHLRNGKNLYAKNWDSKG